MVNVLGKSSQFHLMGNQQVFTGEHPICAATELLYGKHSFDFFKNELCILANANSVLYVSDFGGAGGEFSARVIKSVQSEKAVCEIRPMLFERDYTLVASALSTNPLVRKMYELAHEIIPIGEIGDYYQDSQDVIFLRYVLQHNTLIEQKKIIQKAIHCLKPGGKLLIEHIGPDVYKNDKWRQSWNPVFRNKINFPELYRGDNCYFATVNEVKEWAGDTVGVVVVPRIVDIFSQIFLERYNLSELQYAKLQRQVFGMDTAVKTQIVVTKK